MLVATFNILHFGMWTIWFWVKNVFIKSVFNSFGSFRCLLNTKSKTYSLHLILSWGKGPKVQEQEQIDEENKQLKHPTVITQDD